MTHLRRLYGKHYEQIKGSWLAVNIYRLLGVKVINVKTKVVYKGLKK